MPDGSEENPDISSDSRNDSYQPFINDNESRLKEDLEKSLMECAGAFGGPALETILCENFGKHIEEVRLILQYVPEGGRILDIGGGLGVNLQCIRKLRDSDLRLFLIDRFEEYTEENRMGPSHIGTQRMAELGIEVNTQDLMISPTLPYDSGFFDVVTNFDVVEHLPRHPIALLREIFRVLKRNGKLILGAPNSISLMKRVKLLCGVHPYMKFDLWISDRYYDHYREYSPDEYRKLLEISGFENIRTKLTTEPSRTRAVNHYWRGRHSPFSPTALALWLAFVTETIIPPLRPSVLCVGEKK